MTLREARRTPGYYGRVRKPRKPKHVVPNFELVKVRADGTMLDLCGQSRAPFCADASPHADWERMDHQLVTSGLEGLTAAILILADVPREEALRRAAAFWSRQRPLLGELGRPRAGRESSTPRQG